MRPRSRRQRKDADAILAGKVLYAILAWTGVGVAALLALLIVPGLLRVVPLPDAVVVALGVLRAGLSGLTLGLVFVGWLLGVLAIFTMAALHRLWRAPVVSPWTNRPAARRGT